MARLAAGRRGVARTSLDRSSDRACDL